MTLTPHPTVVAGIRYEDDFVISDDGLRCGRIIRTYKAGRPVWHWYIQPNMPVDGNCTGHEATLEQATSAWRVAWHRFKTRKIDDAKWTALKADQERRDASAKERGW